MATHDIGDVVRVDVEFRDTAGALVDPTTVVFKIKNPVGQTTTYTHGVDAQLVKDAVGKYHVDVEPAIQGVWTYRWEGSGANKGAEEANFTVRESEFD